MKILQQHQLYIHIFLHIFLSLINLHPYLFFLLQFDKNTLMYNFLVHKYLLNQINLMNNLVLYFQGERNFAHRFLPTILIFAHLWAKFTLFAHYGQVFKCFAHFSLIVEVLPITGLYFFFVFLDTSIFYFLPICGLNFCFFICF